MLTDVTLLGVAEMHQGLAQLWHDFNANGGVPVLTAFGGVIVTVAGNYILQERRASLKDRNALRDARRQRGEELYELIDQWTKGVVENSHRLSMKIRRNAFTQADVWNAHGDGNKYTRASLIVDLDFPAAKSALDEVQQEWSKLADLIFPLLKGNIEPTREYGTQIATQAQDIWPKTNEFMKVLTDEIRALYPSPH